VAEVESRPSLSSERPPLERGLLCAGVYERVVAASMPRVWENVFDWEHLPWLHADSFAQVELEARGAWGWRVSATLAEPLQREVRIELRADRRRARYVSATLDGPGSGTEIWTSLAPVAASHTQIRVEFWLSERDPASARRRGQSLCRTYASLWDEDERMMVERTRALAARHPRPESASLCLGSLAEVRASLPRSVELAGRRFHVVERAGRLQVYAAQCPHRLGPLPAVPSGSDHVTCPWHGYRFDVCSGAETSGRPWTLERARVEIDPSSGGVTLHVGEPGEASSEDSA